MTEETNYKEEYQRLVTQDQVNLRERIATELYRRNGFWSEDEASKIVRWIEGKAKVPERMTAKMVIDKLGLGKPKRKYTKRAKRWKKKKASAKKAA